MFILASLAALAAIGLMCWLLFTLAVLALPVFVGLTAGAWANGTGAGLFGAFAVGFLAAVATFAAGQFLLAVTRPLWLKLLVAAAFVVPAAIAGFHATHGIVKHLMPSDAWQIAFSVLGAIAVGVTALFRVASVATASVTSDQDLARA